MQKAMDRLKQAWDENPLAVLFVGALVAQATAKLIDAHSTARSRNTWGREVARRERMTNR